MPILFDDEKIYSLYLEGKLSNLAKVGAMATASLMGNPNTTMADTTYNTAYSSEDMRVLNTDTFVDLWIEYYQTDGKEKGRKKVIEAKTKLSDGVNIPSNAMNAINTAVYIFGGDEGVSPNVLSDLLVYTGEVESLYQTRVQVSSKLEEHEKAYGYWQVEPKTAIDLLINSTAYFGNKFKKRFGNDLLNKIKVNDIETQKYMAKRLLRDDELAAAFAAAKWISVAKRAGLKDIKN